MCPEILGCMIKLFIASTRTKKYRYGNLHAKTEVNNTGKIRSYVVAQIKGALAPSHQNFLSCVFQVLWWKTV